MRLLKRKPKTGKFVDRWLEMTSDCKNRKEWPTALALADQMLDEALKTCGYKGKTIGERLVAAQHDLSNNDGVWFGHKLRAQLDGVDVRTIKKQDIVNALTGFRQALRDLGALPND